MGRVLYRHKLVPTQLIPLMVICFFLTLYLLTIYVLLLYTLLHCTVPPCRLPICVLCANSLSPCAPPFYALIICEQTTLSYPSNPLSPNSYSLTYCSCLSYVVILIQCFNCFFETMPGIRVKLMNQEQAQGQERRDKLVSLHDGSIHGQ